SESAGTLPINHAMWLLEKEKGVYSIQTGQPYWHNRLAAPKSILINDNRKIPDMITKDNRNILGIILANLGLKYREEPRRGGIKIPGHYYSWEHEKVKKEITNFLHDVVSGSYDEKNDINLRWLTSESKRLFERNRVKELRKWNDREERLCTYHAPSLPHNINPDHQYPHQWLWDSYAHAIVLSYIEPKLAKEEIRSLLYAQREDGFMPHMIWNKKKMRPFDKLHARLYTSKNHSAYTQPPLMAEAVLQIYKNTKDPAFVREVLPKLKKYYSWLENTRQRINGVDDGLCEIIGSDESGMDNAPDYDRLYKGPWGTRVPMNLLKIRYKMKGWEDEKVFDSNIFRVKDVLFNTVYAANLRAMAELSEAVGEDQESQE
ncbi:MAG: trehalase family glycosidase, partial [Nitrospirota bacterium]